MSRLAFENGLSKSHCHVAEKTESFYQIKDNPWSLVFPMSVKDFFNKNLVKKPPNGYDGISLDFRFNSENWLEEVKTILNARALSTAGSGGVLNFELAYTVNPQFVKDKITENCAENLYKSTFNACISVRRNEQLSRIYTFVVVNKSQ
jgi:hypothetical protein